MGRGRFLQVENPSTLRLLLAFNQKVQCNNLFIHLNQNHHRLNLGPLVTLLSL